MFPRFHRIHLQEPLAEVFHFRIVCRVGNFECQWADLRPRGVHAAARNVGEQHPAALPGANRSRPAAEGLEAQGRQAAHLQ